MLDKLHRDLVEHDAHVSAGGETDYTRTRLVIEGELANLRVETRAEVEGCGVVGWGTVGF